MKAQLLLGVGTLLLLGGAAFAFAQEPQREPGRGGAAAARAQHGGDRAHGPHRRGERLREARKFVRSLELSEEQRAEARRVARELKPLAEELRPQVREVRDGARELRRTGQREAAREYRKRELEPLREQARERGLPLVRPLIDQLTPEQRAKCEERARAHGREFDPDRAAKRLGLFLSAKRGHRHGHEGRAGDDDAAGPRTRDARGPRARNDR